MGSSQKRRFSATRRARAVLLGAAAMALAALIVSSAMGDTVKTPEMEIFIEGGITPKKLSKKTPTPITLNIEGSIKNLKEPTERPPALSTLALEFDKHGAINTKGLPTCSVSKLQNTTTQAAEKACKPSLVGKGEVEAKIKFPEQAEFPAKGPLLIFNGTPQGGKPVLIFHVYADVPAPTTFVTSGVISKGHGKYGTSTLIQIPTIVGGQGSLTAFQAKIQKSWTYKGKKQSLLTATCPTGQLFAHGAFDFANGTSISGEIIKPCTGT
jgi:hypothetical protein